MDANTETWNLFSIIAPAVLGCLGVAVAPSRPWRFGFGLLAYLLTLCFVLRLPEVARIGTPLRLSAALIVSGLVVILTIRKWNEAVRTDRLRAGALSNSGMRKAATALALRMRTFEARYADKRNAVLHDSKYRSALPLSRTEADEAERKIKWDAKTLALTTVTEDETLEFRNGYLSEAVDLRDQILERLGESAPTPDRRELPAFEGFLVGVRPISAAADYLEQIARLLPK